MSKTNIYKRTSAINAPQYIINFRMSVKLIFALRVIL